MSYASEKTLPTRRDFLVTATAAAGALLAVPRSLRAATRGAVVETAQGRLRGSVDDAGVQVFRGVPFAAPPVGLRRFRPPDAPEGWRGIRDASRPGPSSIQQSGGVSNAPLPRMSEDCLYLNVWTPAADGARRPVLFYIHGGAFIAGTGADPGFDGSLLASEQDVVIVTTNYRLGILGFPPFQLHGADTTSNLGLLDQIAALEWVRENIGAFGGDAGNVTVSGLSAGGWSAACLMTTRRSAGLFRRANLQSPAVMTVIDRERQQHQTATILDDLGLTQKGTRALMTTPAAEILDVQQKMLHAWERSDDALFYSDFLRPFTPLEDGVLFDDHPLRILERGEGIDVPLLIGTTSQEIFPADFRLELPWMKRWYRRSSTVEGLAHMTSPATAQAIWQGYSRIRPDATEEEVAGAIRSDYGYRLPAIGAAEGQHGRAATWVYLFTYAPPKIGISTHATDMVFWFGNMDDSARSAFFFGRAPNAQEKRISTVMRRDLAGFMRGDVGWGAYDLEERKTRIYDLTSTVAGDPLGEERSLWDGVDLRIPS